MSSGGYHHHVGANTWHSPGASLRDLNRAGLAWFAFEAEDDKAHDASAAKLKAAGIPTSNGTNGLEFAARTDLSRMRHEEPHDLCPLPIVRRVRALPCPAIRLGHNHPRSNTLLIRMTPIGATIDSSERVSFVPLPGRLKPRPRWEVILAWGVFVAVAAWFVAIVVGALP